MPLTFFIVTVKFSVLKHGTLNLHASGKLQNLTFHKSLLPGYYFFILKRKENVHKQGVGQREKERESLAGSMLSEESDMGLISQS